MKRFFHLSLLSLLCLAPALRADDASAIASHQEAAENYKILRAKIDDLSEAQTALVNRIKALEKENTDLRAQVAKPTGNYASQDDLKHLADAIKEVDKKRESDNKNILKEIGNLGNSLSKPSTRIKEPAHTDDPTPPPVDPNQPSFIYVIKPGDTYSTIAQAYREKGIKITTDMLEQANPTIKATQLYPGKTKIKIPDTRTADNKPDNK